MKIDQQSSGSTVAQATHSPFVLSPEPVEGSKGSSAPWIFFVPFAITFMDSAFSYFAAPMGFTITANAIVPVILLGIAFCRFRALILPTSTFVWLTILVLSLCLATATAENMSTHRLFEAGSCVASFYAGYLLWRAAADENQLARWLIALSLIYVIICLIALSGVSPARFPIINHYWSQDGVAQARPMVTADSNMQFYYLFPAALAIALPFRLWRTMLTAVAVLGGLYVIVQLQTRSGALAYAGIILLALLAPLWNKELGRGKMLLYPAAMVAAVIVFWPIIFKSAELLLYRFSESDMASGNGRLGSTLYAFEHLLDPYWWIPRGPDEFLRRFGGLPHSNITAIYLDGGLMGLIAWVALIIVPMVQMGRLLLRRQLDAAAIMATIAAAGVFAVQLSLHNPVRDQIWLWAGALVGALVRVQMKPATTGVAAPQSAPASPIRIGVGGVINPPAHQRCLSSFPRRRESMPFPDGSPPARG